MTNIEIALVSPNAKLPIKCSEDAACYDFYASDLLEIKSFIEFDEDTKSYMKLYSYQYSLGIKINIPKKTYLKIVPRSSIARIGAWLGNNEGVIDADFKGIISIILYSIKKTPPYNVGDRICQGMLKELVPTNIIQIEEDKITNTVRGEGGYGHTGK